MSYFRFYIYKAITKVLFFIIFSERSCKGLIFGSQSNFHNIKLCLILTFQKKRGHPVQCLIIKQFVY